MELHKAESPLNIATKMLKIYQDIVHLDKMLGFLPSAIFAPYRLRFCRSDEINSGKIFRRRNKIAAAKQTPRMQRIAVGAAEKVLHNRVCVFFRRSEGVECVS